jgi:hypothetical protein
MGLYKGGLISGWAYTWTIFCVSNKQVRHKQVSHKQGNKRVLSSDYWAYINWGIYIRVGLYSGGGAYIWNDVSISTCGGLIHGGLIFGGGAYSRRFTVYNRYCHVYSRLWVNIKIFIYQVWHFTPMNNI